MVGTKLGEYSIVGCDKVPKKLQWLYQFSFDLTPNVFQSEKAINLAFIERKENIILFITEW